MIEPKRTAPHIPSGQTQKLSILPFEKALEYRSPQSNYDRDHWLYVPEGYDEYRYILGTMGERPLICIGINPSTAIPDRLDNTVKSVARIAEYNGFDSWMMFNVYAQRATRPDDLDLDCNSVMHEENLKAFRYVLKRASAHQQRPVIWAAWGTIVEKRPYLFQCLDDMVRIGKTYDSDWVRAGKISAHGHPHHPLYLRKDSPLLSFDMEEYLAASAKYGSKMRCK